jgi:hypothetical protein
MQGMGNFIILPDARLFLSNGVAKGSAGYGTAAWSINQSCVSSPSLLQDSTDAVLSSHAQDPVLTPAYYDPTAPAGSRFTQSGLPASKIGRLYHSTSTLLPDGESHSTLRWDTADDEDDVGSVFIAGSNPNSDVITVANNATCKSRCRSPRSVLTRSADRRVQDDLRRRDLLP